MNKHFDMKTIDKNKNTSNHYKKAAKASNLELGS